MGKVIMQNGSATLADDHAGLSRRDWPIVAAAALGLTLSVGTLLVSSFGVFVRPLTTEFGWSRTELSGAVAASQYTLAASGWAWGAAIDRFGPRKVVLPSVIIISVLIASLGLLTPHLWHLYLVCAATPLLAGGASPLGYSGILVRKFDRHLGFALGLALTGIGIGGAVLPPLATALVSNFGWRWAYAGLGLLTLVVTLPAAIFATRGLDGATHLRGTKASPSILPLLKTRAYVLVCVAFFLLGAVSIGAMAHFVPMMVDRGFTPVAAASMASLIGISTIVFRVASGWLVDRVHARYVLGAISLLATVALLLLAESTGTPAAYAATILLGAVFGAEADLLAYQVSRYFGPAAFGKLYGIAFGLFVVGVGTGPLLMGASFDRLGGYRPGVLAFAATSVVVAILALALPDYDAPGYDTQLDDALGRSLP